MTTTRGRAATLLTTVGDQRKRHQRLRQLRRLVRAGRYDIPSETIARAILRHYGPFDIEPLTPPTQQR